MKKMLEFIFSPTGFLLVPLVIILFIIVSNIEPIMDKMGFETRSHLKTELTKARLTISLLKEDLHDLKDQQMKFVNQCNIKEEIVTDFVKETEAIDDYIKSVISVNNIVPNVSKDSLIKIEEDSELKSNSEDDIDVVELSNNNIVAINRVYNELFGG